MMYNSLSHGSAIRETHKTYIWSLLPALRLETCRKSHKCLCQFFKSSHSCFDSAKLGSLIDFVLETMEKVQAEKAEIYPLSEPDVSYMVPRNLTASTPNAGSTA
jgi:hypothetical protein